MKTMWVMKEYITEIYSKPRKSFWISLKAQSVLLHGYCIAYTFPPWESSLWKKLFVKLFFHPENDLCWKRFYLFFFFGLEIFLAVNRFIFYALFMQLLQFIILMSFCKGRNWGITYYIFHEGKVIFSFWLQFLILSIEMAVPKVNKMFLEELESMEFPQARATRALHYSG